LDHADQHHKKTADIEARLARADGHLHAVRRMVSEGKPCPDILVQIAAVRAALDRVGRIVLEDHMESCLLDMADEHQATNGWSEIKKALDRYFG
jgi:DNA-binding FrmR family transcriptional regulator